jgi:hypothetical protein
MEAPRKRVIRKRKYSRRGCNECKRRKMKCDEAKPLCHNCLRLNKTCVYPAAAHAPRRPGRIPRPKQLAIWTSPGEQELPTGLVPGLAQEPSPPPPARHALPGAGPDPFAPPADLRGLFDEASVFVHDFADLVGVDLGARGEPWGAFEQGLAAAPMPVEELEVPADWLGASGGGGGGGGGAGLSPALGAAAVATLSPAGASALNSGGPAAGCAAWLAAPAGGIAALVSQFSLPAPHAHYLHLLALTDMLYHMFPFSPSVDANPVMHILLTHLLTCRHLLTLLLAILATFEYNRTRHPQHDAMRRRCLLECLSLLSLEFSGGPGARNALCIERLLFTVLVLTLTFTAVAPHDGAPLDALDSWKAHLRGAKDLLVSYSAVRAHVELAGLALAKVWFFAIESVAGLLSPTGGSLKREAAPSRAGAAPGDVFRDTGYFLRAANRLYHDALARAGLLAAAPSGAEFNLYLGYTIEVVYLNQEFIGALDRVRADPLWRMPAPAVASLLERMGAARLVQLVPSARPPHYVVDAASRAHPCYAGADRVALPASAYGVRAADAAAVSWFDLSQQIRIDALHLRVLLLPHFLALPRHHEAVQALVERIVASAFFVCRTDEGSAAGGVVARSKHFYLPRLLFDARCVMVQAPFQLCIALATQPLQLELLELLFEGLVALGNGSAWGALARARRRRAVLGTPADTAPASASDAIIFS